MKVNYVSSSCASTHWTFCFRLLYNDHWYACECQQNDSVLLFVYWIHICPLVRSMHFKLFVHINMQSCTLVLISNNIVAYHHSQLVSQQFALITLSGSRQYCYWQMKVQAASQMSDKVLFFVGVPPGYKETISPARTCGCSNTAVLRGPQIR
jgi:hypothetical protein